MKSINDAFAAGIDNAARVTLMFTEDFKDGDWTYRIVPDGNCAAWLLGHLVMASRMMMSRCGVSGLPLLPEGFETRFARDETAPMAVDFGDTVTLRPLFQQHHDRFAGVARGMSADQLAKPLDHPMFKSVGQMLSFAPVHIATHAGQISAIRRSLGRKPLV